MTNYCLSAMRVIAFTEIWEMAFSFTKVSRVWTILW